MIRQNNKLTDSGFEILTISDQLTNSAKTKLATRIIHADNIYLAVEELLSSTDIHHIIKSLEELKQVNDNYKKDLYYSSRHP